MEWPKVKTALIIMLAVLNGFLAAVYLMRFSETYAMEKDALNNAYSVIRARGIEIDDAILKKSYEVIYTYEAARDRDIESLIAKAFTGSGESVEQGSNTVDYRGPDGTARFGSTGSFEIDIINTPAANNDMTAFFTLLGIDIKNAALSVDESGMSARIIQEIGGIKLANWITVIYYDEDSKPHRIEGRRINGELTVTDAVYSRSVVTAVMTFIDYAVKNNIKCEKIVNIELCYDVTIPAPGFYRLNPAWELSSDAGIYHIGVTNGIIEAVD